MPKSTDACNRFVNLLYSATAWANVADNAATAPLTNVAVRLHTGLLTAATNSQAENEVAYTNYVGQNVARSTGWDTASGGSTANSALLQFPQSGATGASLSVEAAKIEKVAIAKARRDDDELALMMILAELV